MVVAEPLVPELVPGMELEAPLVAPEPLVLVGLPEPLVVVELSVLVALEASFVVVLAVPDSVEALAVPANTAQMKASANASLQPNEIARRLARCASRFLLRCPIPAATSSQLPTLQARLPVAFSDNDGS